LNPLELVLAAALGAVCLAISATLWALVQRRRATRRVTDISRRLAAVERDAAAAFGAIEAGGGALISIDRTGRAYLASGDEPLLHCAASLGCAPAPHDVIDTLLSVDPGHRRKLEALFGGGQPCTFEARGSAGPIRVDGGAAGAMVWLRLTPGGDRRQSIAGERLAGFLNVEADPAWIARAGGELIWANMSWLRAVDAASLEEAKLRGLIFDKAAEPMIAEAARTGQPAEALHWITAGGQRRAFRVTAIPLESGDVAMRAADVTETEDMREAIKRLAQAHDETLNHIADAVAVFDAAKRLTFYNTTFAELWRLEPAWLSDRPSHGELLDRLRQRRSLPETADYAGWKARELAHYETLSQGPDELWTLPDGRTLRVVRQPHPMGGILILFSDITGELRLKAQYNALIQVQQATLDKLNDAVAVFGSDGRLRLHNEAFERFWNVSKSQMDDAGDFDGVVVLCTPRLHDQAFWRELKGRVTDPDPQARVPTGGDARTGDDRIVAWQSRPLPDGATLIGFADVTDTKMLEKAVHDRSLALAEAERLKRDFVGNVSYELRTPLTTILGYSELLEYAGANLPAQARGHVASVRTAATQLARSIDDVLNMAQIDADEMRITPADIEVCELLTSVADRFRRESDVGETTVAIECPPEVGLIRADAYRLGQALDHLMENALRESPKGGVITLAARRSAAEITLMVTDQGRGIAYHVQAHIFDRFVGRERGGPGLGLALVKSLVELHGGWVALESEPGKGSTFTLHLPEIAYDHQSELFAPQVAE